MSEMKCENCLFGRYGGFPRVGAALLCHRHAPTVVQPYLREGIDQFQSIWPMVSQSDFCGDWQAILPLPNPPEPSSSSAP